MKRGFSLIEVIIAVVILGVIASIVMASFSSLQNRQALNADKLAISSLLEEARANTLSAKGDSVHGVHFETGVATLFESSYSAGASGNETQNLSSQVSISNISLAGGGSDVIFQKLTGATDHNGTITFTDVEGNTVVITIYNSGTSSY